MTPSYQDTWIASHNEGKKYDTIRKWNHHTKIHSAWIKLQCKWLFRDYRLADMFVDRTTNHCWDFWWNFGKDDSEGEVQELNEFPCHTQAVERYVKQWQRPWLLCVVLRAETDTFGQDLLPAEKCLHSTVNANIKLKQNNLNLMVSNFMWKLRTS